MFLKLCILNRRVVFLYVHFLNSPDTSPETLSCTAHLANTGLNLTCCGPMPFPQFSSLLFGVLKYYLLYKMFTI